MPKVKRKSAAASRRKRQAVHTESSSGVGEADATTTTTTTPSEEAQSTEPATSKMLPCTSHKVTRMLADFRHLLTSHAASHPECAKYAPAISKYMRNQFPFLGLKAPARRALQKQFLAEHGSSFEDRQTLTEFVGGLWEEEERDFQGFGVDLLAQYRETLLGDTEEHFREAVGVVKHCVITKSWWDTVDAISYPVFGYMVKQKPSLGLPVVWEWIDHDYMWLRRVAILHQLAHKKSTDEDLLFKLCLRRAEETEFFIRKAIGWALREHSKSNKKAVKSFVEKNKSSLSALSVREALKHC